MLHSKGFSAWISVDNASLDTFGKEIFNQGKVVTCWIPSQAGKEFSVCWRDSVEKRATHGQVKVDGIECGGKSIRPRSRRKQEPEACRSYFRVSDSITRPFLFSGVELTDDDSYLGTATQNIGEIVLKITRITLLGSVHPIMPTLPPSMALKVHERSKKIVSHRVTFGEEIKRPKKYAFRQVFVDDEPMVTFIFKYRPFEFLRANGTVMLRKNQRAANHGPEKTGIMMEVIEIEDSDPEEPKFSKKPRKSRSMTLSDSIVRSNKLKTESTSRRVIISSEVIDLTMT